MQRRHSREGVFTYQTDTIRYSLRRGERIIDLVKRYPNSVGVIGEDVAIEKGVSGKPIGPIERNGQQLRFALLAGRRGLALVQLQNTEYVSVVTSYPKAAQIILNKLGINARITVVKGCIEAELQPDSEFTVAIEAVQSGGSVRDNNLFVVEDYLWPLQLMKIGNGELL